MDGGGTGGSWRRRTLRAFARAGLALAAIVILTAAAGGAAAGERIPITIYTAIENEQIAAIDAGLRRAVPEVEPLWTRGSTGVITDRLLAEAAQPQADLVFGLAASSLTLLKQAGLLAAYEPPGAGGLRSLFRDPTPPHAWTGMDAYLGAICFNAGRAAAAGLLPPQLWRELLAPGLKGQIAMPNPNLSGTGFLLVAGWLQSMGEAGGWAYMDALDQNVSAYLPSGSAPCYAAARGEVIAGLSFDMRAATEKANGAPIDIIVPVDGVGWEQEAVAILGSTRHRALAQRIVDWAASREANEIYARSFAVVADPDVSNPHSIYPPHAEARMIRNDLAWGAANRARILREWTRRYGAKARPG
ncbi:extracellular solute-binding protein [Methylobacterium planeticum]|uniref:Extracellular solute-binding protein n=1 Tax=Methylobacterium planeticum TaxID=2615211 RepID=A0A6N6MS50_9HYPH|nr:extracellular solute-binding protein [Methylobacterium planeticum]KAB1074367.1 extracellular solute-binding protein [Methylobacterium planeticum]